MPFGRKRREDVRVELTPMVDVVFLLLIFFMISTTFIETPGLSIRLPESSLQVAEKEPQELRVYLTKQGEIYIQEERLTPAQFDARLRAMAEQSRQMTFLLLADQEARHGDVVRLMDAAKAAGFGKLAIATEQAKVKK